MEKWNIRYVYYPVGSFDLRCEYVTCYVILYHLCGYFDKANEFFANYIVSLKILLISIYSRDPYFIFD